MYVKVSAGFLHVLGTPTGSVCNSEVRIVNGEVKAKIKISPVVVFGVLSRMVLVRES